MDELRVFAEIKELKFKKIPKLAEGIFCSRKRLHPSKRYL